MKDSKSILLLIVSVLLILVSFTLLWTWGFTFNNFSKEKSHTRSVVKDAAPAANKTRDSLQKIYKATINNMSAFDSTLMRADSLKDNLDIKLDEFYKLRNEITSILKNPANKEDLDLAKQKIAELQKRVDQLRDKNLDVEKENARLIAVLQQLTNVQKQSIQNVKPLPVAKTNSPENYDVTSGFIVADIRLSAIMVDGGKEQETIQALQTDKFVGSFIVNNNNREYKEAEVVVVILSPDGRTLQNSAWETGRFDTRQGKKIYTSKLKFEYSKGESKRLSFSLGTDKFMKGSYTMQVYQNGIMIGKLVKTLI